ncbi:MAG: sulfurtransferase TusA family protein [Exilibacterium sp.]
MNDDISVTHSLDASGLACPMPLLKAKQGLNTLNRGETLKVIATDPGSVRDFRAFAQLSGNELISFVESDNHYIYILKKA